MSIIDRDQPSKISLLLFRCQPKEIIRIPFLFPCLSNSAAPHESLSSTTQKEWRRLSVQLSTLVWNIGLLVIVAQRDRRQGIRLELRFVFDSLSLWILTSIFYLVWRWSLVVISLSTIASLDVSAESKFWDFRDMVFLLISLSILSSDLRLKLIHHLHFVLMFPQDHWSVWPPVWSTAMPWISWFAASCSVLKLDAAAAAFVYDKVLACMTNLRRNRQIWGKKSFLDILLKSVLSDSCIGHQYVLSRKDLTFRDYVVFCQKIFQWNSSSSWKLNTNTKTPNLKSANEFFLKLQRS